MLKHLFHRKGNDKEDKLMQQILSENEETTAKATADDTQKQSGSVRRIAEIDVLINGVKEKSYPLYPGRLLVGRDPGQVDLVISELIVSKSHCTFLVSSSEVLLRDNGSTNGTYVQGEVVEEYRISEDVLVSLGKKGVVQLHVRFLDQQEPESTVGDTVIA